MRVPLSWLREFVAVEVPPEALAHRLTMAGAEVGAIEHVDAAWRRVVVGRIEDLQRHRRRPDLFVASVDVGEARRTLVTAATNLQEGDRVAVVLAGGGLASGAVDERTFDGVVSEGMLCSGAELGVAEDRTGIYVLEPEAPLGAELASYLGDVVLDVEVTPNRPDLLSVVGVAREVAALTGAGLRVPEPHAPSGPTPIARLVSVEIEAPDLCPRYSATAIEGVRVGPSPLWLQRRLHLSGMRPISNVVDVTNYVMLELGQPLHAFDGAALHGGIRVRRALSGERLRTIDGADRELTDDMLVIADARGAVAVAGVMGGAATEVSATTTRVVIESALFDPRAVRRTSRALRLPSEAARRFERGVDPGGTLRAAHRATALIMELAGGQPAAGHVDAYPRPEPPCTIRLAPADLNGLLGGSYSADTITTTLRGLGFAVDVPALPPAEDGTGPPSPLGSAGGGGEVALLVHVPSFRRDIAGIPDLAEEVARIRGYDTIPTRLPVGQLPPVTSDPARRIADVTRRTLVACGFQEVITYSLVRADDTLRVDSAAPWPVPTTDPTARDDDTARANAELIPIHNPMSAEHAHLRTTLVGSLLSTLTANLRHRDRVYLFELARVYLPPLDPLPTEQARLGLVLCGPRNTMSWHAPPEPGDFFDLKGAVEAVLGTLRVVAPRFAAAEHPALHPGRSASVYAGEARLGILGQLHPVVAERFELAGRAVFAAELDFDALARMAGDQPLFLPLPRLPGVAVDLAVVVEESVFEADVAAAIREAGAPLLADVRLFDVYRGAAVTPGHKSLAYALLYRAPERTLTDQETARAHAAVEAALRDRLGGTIRGR